MIKVYNPGNITEANIVGGMLAAHDIQVYVGGQYLQGGIGDLSPLDLASIEVPEHQVDEALSLIRRYENGGLHSQDEVTPPVTEDASPEWQEPLVYMLIIGAILGLYLLLV